MFCPCGNTAEYQDCCGLFLAGKANAQTAEQLMRSRYTAFSKGNIDYLIATLHSSKRKPEDRAILQKRIDESKWLGLKIIDTEQGEVNDEYGYVEFAAFSGNTIQGQLHERSEFIREDGKWFYVQGEIKEAYKLGRNEVCWCGSGKKYKKCHGP